MNNQEKAYEKWEMLSKMMGNRKEIECKFGTVENYETALDVALEVLMAETKINDLHTTSGTSGFITTEGSLNLSALPKESEINMNDLELKRSTYPRVSEIIGMQNERNMRGIPLEMLANAAERGTKSHAYCTAHANGLYLPDIEEECKKGVDAWIEWSSSNLGTLIKSNERLYDDTLCFSGEPDMICLLKNSNKLVLLDLKFAAKSSLTWPVQLAAYKHLCLVNRIDVEEVYNLHFKKNSKGDVLAVLIPYDDLTPYRHIFHSALRCFKYFSNKGEII